MAIISHKPENKILQQQAEVVMMPTSKPPVLPADLSGAVPISAQIPVRVFPCFRARDPGAPPLIDLSRVVLEASRKSFVGLDRSTAVDLLRPILAEFGLRGGAELTTHLSLAEVSEREAVGSRSFQRAVGTHVVLEYALHELRAHLKVVDEIFVLLPAPVLFPETTIKRTTIATPLLAATAAAASSTTAVTAEQDPALSSSPRSSSGSQAGTTTTTTTPEATLKGATTAPTKQRTATAHEEEAKGEPSDPKESLLPDHRSTREVNEKHIYDIYDTRKNKPSSYVRICFFLRSPML